MIVCIGNAPSFVLKTLRDLFYNYDNVFIYPEFYDSKSALLSMDYARYIRNLLLLRDKVFIAIWPDYSCTRFVNTLPQDVLYVYPLHDLEELKCIRIIGDHGYTIIPGYCSAPETRSYSLLKFIRAVNPKEAFYLGAGNRKELREAVNLKFWGVDVVVPGFYKRKNQTLSEYVNLISRLIK